MQRRVEGARPDNQTTRCVELDCLEASIVLAWCPLMRSGLGDVLVLLLTIDVALLGMTYDNYATLAGTFL